MAQLVKEKCDEKLLNFIKENYMKEWEMAGKVSAYVMEGYECHFTEEEKLYFAIQIKRMNDLLG